MIPMIPASIALAGLDAPALGINQPARAAPGSDRGEEVRQLLSWAKGAGFRGVQLNATTPGVRPRDLDRSGRRDLAASLRRADLQCSGLDLWIPEAHFTDPLNVDRAVAATLAAIDLAGDLAMLASGSVVTAQPGRPGVVSVLLPRAVASDVLATFGNAAQARGVLVADHLWPERDPPANGESNMVGIDPAALLAAGQDPAAAVSRCGRRVASARLTDVARGLAGARTAPGSRDGTLDVLAYRVSLATSGYSGFAVVDLRGVTNQAQAARVAVEATG